MSARQEVLEALQQSAEPLTRKDLVEVISEESLSGLDTALNNLFHEGRIVRMDDTRPYKYTLAPGTAQVARRRAMTDSAPAPQPLVNALAEPPASEQPPPATTRPATADKFDGAPIASKRRGGTPTPSPRALAKQPTRCRALSNQLRAIARLLDDWPTDAVPAEAVSMIERCTREAA